MKLHLSGDPGIVPAGPVYEMGGALHHGRDGFSPGLVKYRWIRYTDDVPASEGLVLVLDPLYLRRDLRRVELDPRVRCPGTAVILLNPV